MKIQPLSYMATSLKQNSVASRKDNYKTAPMAYDSISFGNIENGSESTKEPRLSNRETVEIFNAMGVRAKVKLDRTISIYKYVPNKRQMKKLEALGVDENILFENVTQIEGSMDLSNSKLKSLQGIREIGGFLIVGPNLKDFGELIGIGGNLNLLGSDIKTPQKIQYIGGDFLRDTSDYFKPFNKICIEGSTLVYNFKNGKYHLVNYY